MSRTAFILPFKLLGIPIELNFSLLLALPLMAWLIGRAAPSLAQLLGLPPDTALWQGSTPFLLGILAAVGLFLSVLVHELGHTVVGKRYGVQVQKITLWLFGGVAHTDEMPRKGGAEAIIAIAGPITSVLLAGLLWLVRYWVPISAVGTHFVLGYLMLLNLVLAVFNLLPALPMDGGRILRSVLALYLPYGRATAIAGLASRGIALLMGLWGALTFNLWLIVLAFFVYTTGSTEARYVAMGESLKGYRVRDLMTPNVEVVTPHITASELLLKMSRERHTCYPVVDLYGKPLGLVHLRQLHAVEPTQPARDFMQSPIPTIHPGASAQEALKQIAQSELGRLVVVDEQERMMGILSRSDLLRILELQSVAQNLEGKARPQQP